MTCVSPAGRRTDCASKGMWDSCLAKSLESPPVRPEVNGHQETLRRRRDLRKQFREDRQGITTVPWPCWTLSPLEERKRDLVPGARLTLGREMSAVFRRLLVHIGHKAIEFHGFKA